MFLNHDPGLAKIIGLPELQRPNQEEAVMMREMCTPASITV
jgi:hypothetical protein